MTHEGEDIFEITETNEDFQYWAGQSFIPWDLKEGMQKADILLVPTLGFKDNPNPNFPPLTEELFNYFKKHASGELTIDIAVGDDNFATLALNSDYKRFGKYVVTTIAIPVFISVLSNYINKKLEDDPKPNITVINNVASPDTSSPIKSIRKKKPKHPHRFLEPAKVSFTVTVVDTNGRSIKYDYRGPASEVKKVTDVLQKDWVKPNDHK